LPDGSVAVAVRARAPAGGRTGWLNDAKPSASVVTLTEPRKTRPCAEPFGLTLVSAKSCTVKVVFGVLVNVPVTRTPPGAGVAAVRTGAAWLLLAPGESLMPRPLLSKMEFRRMALPCPDFTHTPWRWLKAMVFPSPGKVPPITLPELLTMKMP